MTSKDIRRVGFNFAIGAIMAVAIWLAFSFLFAAAIEGLGLRPLDATDARNGQRSEMKLRTDHGTGCQYLATAGGGITPRLGRDGKQMCR